MCPEDYIPISLVAHYVFCPRRAWLEAQGEVVDSAQIQVGISAHKRVDEVITRGIQEYSSVELKSAELGITGKTDVLLCTNNGLRIREYKSTPVRKNPTITESMRMQLALQVICLEEAGWHVASTEVYFKNHNSVVAVQIDEECLVAARVAVAQTKETIQSTKAPLPLEDDARCSFCSHASVCLPDEHYLKKVNRTVRPPIRETKVIHLTTPGSYGRLSKGRMIVEMAGEELAGIPLETVQALQLHGNVNLSGGLIKELLNRSIPIQWCTGSGRMVGWAQSSSGPNGQAREAQYALAISGSLSLPKAFIKAKIANQATQLRRAKVDKTIISMIRDCQHACDDARSLEGLLGVEGKAASLYFANWPMLLKGKYRGLWPWHGRSGRPAVDAINAMLNYAYSLLVAETTRAIIACGLDPHTGFLHTSNRNKPALALDLMEEVRAPIADSVVQTMINCQMVAPEDFTSVFGGVRMNNRARKALIRAYERRMAQEFIHPLFGYRVTWRRALEVQARQVLGVIEGSQLRYEGIMMR